MRAPLVVILEYVAAALPGWLFIGAGAAILAGTVLMPDYKHNQQLTCQRDELKRQASLIEAQRQRYSDFNEALVAQDPQLLERLAYSQLHLRPADADLWQPQGDVATVAWSGLDDALEQLAQDPLASSSSVDAALAEPIENIQPRLAELPPPSRLERLTTGTSRLGLIVAAMTFIVGGLFFSSETR